VLVGKSDTSTFDPVIGDFRAHAFRWRDMLTDLGVPAGMVSSQAGLTSSFRPPGQTFYKEENSYETFRRRI
jgi:hypothetical protein